MNHIRFMHSKQTICQNPRRLDHFDSPVVTDVGPEKFCTECRTLLFAHNQREFDKEQNQDLDFHNNGPSPVFRGIVYGVLLSIPIWVVIFLLSVWVAKHAF